MSVAALAADPSGTYKWSQPGRNGGPARESTLTLAVKDGKLTGKLSAPGRDGVVETEISNAAVKDDTVSFEVARDMGGNKVVAKYSGKLEGDTITGKVEAPGRDGAVQSRDWVAKKAAAAAK